jgi:hypothetical protein
LDLMAGACSDEGDGAVFTILGTEIEIK